MEEYGAKALQAIGLARKRLTRPPVSLQLLVEQVRASTQAKQKAALVLCVLVPLGFGLKLALLLPLVGALALALVPEADLVLAKAVAHDKNRLVELLRHADRADEALSLRGLSEYDRILCLRALAGRKLRENDAPGAKADLEQATELALRCMYTPLDDRVVSESDYDKSLEVAEAFNELGSFLVDTKGDLAEAEKCFEQAINIGAKTVSRADPRVTVWLMNLGIFKQQQLGKADEGLALFEEVLDIRKKILGENDPLVAKWLIDMAFLLLSRPDADAIGTKIEDLVQQALAIRKVAFGGDHELVAEVLGHCALMAALTAQDGDPSGLEKARDYGKQSAEMYERVLGKDHPLTQKAKADWGV